MTVTRIHNEDWGFETNCFVCEPRNDQGLRIPFFHDDELELVFADFTLPSAFSGAPTLIHGGVTLAVLDEAMAWACIAVAHRWAVTTETTTRFAKPVFVDRPYRVEARITSPVGAVDETTLTTSGVVLDHKGQVRAEASATFTVLGAAQAVRAIGADPGSVADGYVRDTTPPST
jgi:acyl-coenzyme A thioesterase PaaI-like protein